MKKFLALLLIILMAFAVGCVTDSNDDKDNDDNNDSGTGTTQSAETYLPLKVGSTWTYSETITSYWEDEPDVYTSTYTTTVTGTSVQNEKTYWALSVEQEWGSSEAYIRIDGDNVYVYDPNWALKPAVEGENALSKTSADKIAGGDEEVLVFKFNQPAGHTWTIDSNTDSGEGYSYTFTSTGKYFGLENVTTAAGTFTGCARFDETRIDNSTYEGEAYSSTTMTSRWLAPNVGLVKDSETFMHEGDTVNELFESVCTSYSIPEDETPIETTGN